MGNRPSLPSEAQQDDLERRQPELLARAATAIHQADVLLVSTGAGWSADSGLAVYKDVADLPAYHARNLSYRDICQPHWLEEDPALFYGFWGGCYNDCARADASPHCRTIASTALDRPAFLTSAAASSSHASACVCHARASHPRPRLRSTRGLCHRQEVGGAPVQGHASGGDVAPVPAAGGSCSREQL